MPILIGVRCLCGRAACVSFAPQERQFVLPDVPRATTSPARNHRSRRIINRKTGHASLKVLRLLQSAAVAGPPDLVKRPRTAFTTFITCRLAFSRARSTCQPRWPRAAAVPSVVSGT